MDLLCKKLRGQYEIAAITNDIYTKWDAEYLVRSGALAPERIAGVETGGCPHTAIREDASINLAAIAEMRAKFPDLDLVLIESGGDNLAATFSPELADLTIYVIDVAAGDKIPSKGGPGITRSDLLVINKVDLAPYVGASLDVMERDAKKMRGARPFVFTNLRTGQGIDDIVRFIVEKGGLGALNLNERAAVSGASHGLTQKILVVAAAQLAEAVMPAVAMTVVALPVVIAAVRLRADRGAGRGANRRTDRSASPAADRAADDRAGGAANDQRRPGHSARSRSSVKPPSAASVAAAKIALRMSSLQYLHQMCRKKRAPGEFVP